MVFRNGLLCDTIVSMRIKAALIDLDDTICNTRPIYDKAIANCTDIFNASTGLGWSLDKFTAEYEKARKEVKLFITFSAASSNRAIYFQRMVEKLDSSTNFDLVHDLYNAYYGYVYKNLALFPNATTLLKWLHESGRKIIIVSDGNAHVRIEKIHALRISEYVDYLVSSEEAGVGKPAEQPFLMALNKAKIRPEEAIMIGNKANADIYGANKVGIITIQTEMNHDPADKPKSEEETPRYTVNDLMKVQDIIEYLETH